MSKTMDKIFEATVITLIIVFLIGAFCLTAYIEDTYTLKNCEIVEVAGDVITAEDFRGRLWDFYGDGYEVGDTVDLVMSGDATPFESDDRVERVK